MLARPCASVRLATDASDLALGFRSTAAKMPRWGLRAWLVVPPFLKARQLTRFAGILDDDHFVSHAVQVSRHIAQGDKAQFTHLLACFYYSAPPRLQSFYIEHLENELTMVDDANLDSICTDLSNSIREKLNAGLGWRLFKGYREQAEATVESAPLLIQTRYHRIIVLTVALMTCKQLLGEKREGGFALYTDCCTPIDA